MSGIRVSMKVTGLDEQITRFKNAELNLQAHEIGDIINFALEAVKTEAQAKAPFVTGRLRNSIVNYMISDLAGECVAMAPYAASVEFGYVGKGGNHIAGRKYFTPAAIHGGKILIAELQQYVINAYKGPRIKPKSAARGGSAKGSTAHKFLYKIPRGSGGSQYVYSKKSTTVTTFKPLLYPGPGKQFPKPRKAGRRSRSR